MGGVRGGVDLQFYSFFLTSALDGNGWLMPDQSALPPGFYISRLRKSRALSAANYEYYAEVQ